MGWWVIMTGPAQERRAEQGLIEAGFDVWLPQRLVSYRTRHMRVACTRHYPTFPGYLFARSAGLVPIWQWERELGAPDPRTGLCHPCGPETKRKIAEHVRDVDWRDALIIDGVVDFIRPAEGMPLVLRDAELERVRAHLDAIAEKPVDAQAWRTNDLARITDGPFAGLEGIVTSTSHLAKRGSLTLLLEMFGRKVPAEHLVEQLERAA